MNLVVVNLPLRSIDSYLHCAENLSLTMEVRI